MYMNAFVFACLFMHACVCVYVGSHELISTVKNDFLYNINLCLS